MSQQRVTVVPLTLPVANELVAVLHRHHPPIPGGFGWWAVGAVIEGELRGAAIAGRPTNRNNDDGGTVEVLRVATDGAPNACSALLGACQRAAKAIGAWRIITYTLDEESGTSLRAVGWTCERTGIRSFWTTAGTRPAGVHRAHSDALKVRWAAHFRQEAVTWTNPHHKPPVDSGQGELLGVVALDRAGET